MIYRVGFLILTVLAKAVTEMFSMFKLFWDMPLELKCI